MKQNYYEFDGQGGMQNHLSPDELFPSPQVMEFILEHGEDALDAMNQIEDDEGAEFIRQMIEAGLLEEYEDEDGNTKLRMTNRLVRGFQHRALLEMFADLKKGNRDGHPSPEMGRSAERTEGTRPYQFGDPISEVDVNATLRNAVARQAKEALPSLDPQKHDPNVGPKPVSRLPLRLNLDDLELHQTESTADCATVMLIDQSGSMMRYGRFLHAKRVALGMAELIRARFPQDTIDFFGFASLVERLRERDLPVMMPKPVTIRDYEVRLRVPLEQAYENQERVPPHFTNLQLGLCRARQLLSRSGASNKQVFIITDGQPTAHVQTSQQTGDDMLYLLYPPDARTRDATLAEAMKCSQQGIRLTTFALIEDYWGMDWVGFVDQITRLTKGLAYYCASHDLSSTVIESYLGGRKSRKFVH
ncbi:MAG: VWA domain-containing protein [Planctomycetota bacterium]